MNSGNAVAGLAPRDDLAFRRFRKCTLCVLMSDLVSGYAPLLLGVYRYENLLVYPWVLGFKYNAFMVHPWKFLDIDLARRNAG